MARLTEEERFFAKVKKIPDGCWEWQATIGAGSDGGYGVFYGYDPLRGKKTNMQAHRWSYLHHIGPIPADKIVMHTCDNRRCVNPEHLKLGTLKDNATDMMLKGRWGGPVGEDHFNTNLTEQQVEKIRKEYVAGTLYQHQLAKKFGVGQSTISRIVRGEVWARAAGPQGPGRPQRGARHHAAKLTTEDVADIRSTYLAGGITQRELAALYGVSAKHISEIVRGNKRKHE